MDKVLLARTLAAVWYRQMRCWLHLNDDLTRIASKFPSDKGITFFPFNGYATHYHALIHRLRRLLITLLEIGLSRKRDRSGRRVACPSLEIWAEYFPNATILSFDLDDFSMVRLPRTTIYRGDQGRSEDLLSIVAEHLKLDIVIDDGSHASFHQQVSLRTLWPFLTTGGMYFIEDLDLQPVELERVLPSCPLTIDLLKERMALAQQIGGVTKVSLYDSPLRDATDTMACIVKQ
jgi:hypothetical protein